MNTLVLLIVISIFCRGYGHNEANIAIAVQGKAVNLADWIKMVSLMKTKELLTLFVLSFDFPIDKHLCRNRTQITCLFQSKTTWRSGRNMMIRSISNYKKRFSHHFKYWMFADDDVNRIESCFDIFSGNSNTNKTRDIEMAAVCFDFIIHKLSSPNVQYAVVGYKNFNLQNLVKDALGFMHADCCDGALLAIHHLAVPILLPYVELLDNITWWAPIWKNLQVGCFPGYSVFSQGLKHRESHSPYPKNMKNIQVLMTKALRQVYTPLGIIPYPITEKNLKTPLIPGNCAGITESQVNYPSWRSDGWLELDSYKKCYKQLRPRFIKFIENNDLASIDGENYLLSE